MTALGGGTSKAQLVFPQRGDLLRGYRPAALPVVQREIIHPGSYFRFSMTFTSLRVFVPTMSITEKLRILGLTV